MSRSRERRRSRSRRSRSNSERNRSDISDRKRPRRDKSLEKSSSTRRHKTHKHKRDEDRYEKRARENEERDTKHRKSCRHHRHHHKKSKNNHKDKEDAPADALHESNAPEKEKIDDCKFMSNRNVGLESDVTPLDEKEIYAEGDKIIVNVNFSKTEVDKATNSESKKGDSAALGDSDNIESNQNSMLSKPGDPPTKDVKLGSKSKTKFDIFWDGKSVKSDEESSNYETKDSIEKKDHEPSFLPRILANETKSTNSDVMLSNSVQVNRMAGPETPPDDEQEAMPSSPDPQIPTPTQDESLELADELESLDPESYESGNNLNIRSPSSPSPIPPQLTPDGIQTDDLKKHSLEIYNPEAPLESSSDEDFDLNLSNSNKSQAAITSSAKGIEMPRSPPDNSPQLASLKSPKNNVNEKSRKIEFNETKCTYSKQDSSFKKTTTITVSTPSPTQSNVEPNLMPHTPTKLPPAPPGSLLGQIQKTLSQKNKSNPSQQQHLCNAIENTLTSSETKNITHVTDRSNNANIPSTITPSCTKPLPPVVSSTSRQQGAINIFGSKTPLDPSLKHVIDQLLKAAEAQQQSKKIFKTPVANTSKSSSSNGLQRSNGEFSSASSSSRQNSSGHTNSSGHLSVKAKLHVRDNKSSNRMGIAASSTNIKLSDVTIVEELPSSAVELNVKEKYLKKLNRQERVIEEVKLVLKPYYQKRQVTKDEYKEVLKKSVPKVCHNKTGEINPVKIKALVDGYVKRIKYNKKLKKRRSIGSKKSSISVVKSSTENNNELRNVFNSTMKKL